MMLETPGILVSIPATGTEPCQRYACDAHPGVSLKNEPYAHRRGLHCKDYAEVVLVRQKVFAENLKECELIIPRIVAACRQEGVARYRGSS
jgi:hypothetical protein